MKTHLVLNRLVLLCAVLIAAFARAADEPGVGLESLKNYVASLEGERREAGEFLLEHLPEADQKSLSTELFRENLEQAYLARETYPWTKALPKELFFNDVLPHAVVNETRDASRKRLREIFHSHLGDSQDVRAAAAGAAAGEALAGQLGAVPTRMLAQGRDPKAQRGQAQRVHLHWRQGSASHQRVWWPCPVGEWRRRLGQAGGWPG